MPLPVAISVEGLSKRYLVGHNAPSADRNATLRDGIVHGAKDLARKTRDMFSGRQIVQGDSVEEFWALRDVSFDIPQGARIGIIGRNGAGKSTLLKLLSRITEPTHGRITVTGRVASLLEVGTGFHPELSGRENIFLNGAILGMSQREIQAKFDEIVDFAEVERFLDTPVKRYSSGMYVRLAFAIAAHLQSEVLIVDEVLAVGDVQFQQKCLGKMKDVANSGRTVLFVSHNFAAVGQLCDSAILLRGGQLQFQGEIGDAMNLYMTSGSEDPSYRDLRDVERRQGTGAVQFIEASLRDARGERLPRLSMGDSVEVRFAWRACTGRRLSALAASIEIRSSDGTSICNVVNGDSGVELPIDDVSGNAIVRFHDIRLYPGTYRVALWIGTPDGRETFDYVENALSLEITDGGRLTKRALPRSSGIVFLTPSWEFECTGSGADKRVSHTHLET